MPGKNRGQPPERVRRPWLPSDRALDAIDRAMADGFFDNLPGRGKPLDLSDDDNPFVPDDMRLAYRVLRNAGVRLPWIEERKVIDARRADLERQIERHATWLRGELDRINRIPAYLRSSRRARLQAEHVKFVETMTSALEEVNERISMYNLSVPVVSGQIFPLDPQKFLARARVEFPPET